MIPNKNKNNTVLASSFRDPNGFLFVRDGKLYRQVNTQYRQDYDHLMSCGLYERLVKVGLLISHEEVPFTPPGSDVHKVLEPERLRFISYPYEWSFSQLRDAALVTMRIQKIALKHGMTLKDASAYNIQFHQGMPTLIDTLSFEVYKEGSLWDGYRQFCQHFLAPLALMAKKDIRLGQLLRVYIDGVPLDLASRLLPASTRFQFGLLTHIHLHSKAQSQYADKLVSAQPRPRKGISRQALLALVDDLISVIRKLEWNPSGTEWGNYYDITNYSDSAFDYKKRIISEWVEKTPPQTVWDLGANNGIFTRIASERGIPSIAFDIDPAAVEQNYRQVKSAGEKNILPLVQDLTNPSPAIGWHNCERESFMQRAPADMVFALAVIHHLAISNNVPLPQLAKFFHDVGRQLVIEFVPKTDSQVKKLLASRLDIFDEYHLEGFERAFKEYFVIREKAAIQGSERWLYLMERRV